MYRKIICLYGGPGVGKSVACAGLYYKLKIAGHHCEMNREYIKEWIWEGRVAQDGDQTYFFAKQARRERLYIKQNMEFIITDSPLILTHFYGMKNDICEQKYNTSLTMLKHHHGYCKDNGYKTDHFLLKRANPYSESGRFQSEDEAEKFDIEIKQLLDAMEIKYTEVLSDINCVDNILKAVK